MRGIYVIDPEDKEFKETIKNARKKLETPVAPAMPCKKLKIKLAWPGGWGLQGMRKTGGGGLARVPNLRVYYHLLSFGWHTQGGKDELTSCRGTV